MFQTILSALRSADLRKKLLFTAFILLIYRFGSFVPVPGVDLEALQVAIDERGSRLLEFLNLFAGGALTRFAVFALGIMPYITASIILQLMTVVIPTLEKLQKEGEAGQQKITQYTRYFTVALAFLQSIAYVLYFRSQDALPGLDLGTTVLIVISVTTGTTLLMWLGELITQRGVGNGISLLIFASIVVSVPDAIQGWVTVPPVTQAIILIITLAVVVGVVFVNEGQRRIPIQYAKRVVGRRMTSGGTYLMASIAAVVIGGTPLTGGRGSLVASFAGAIFMSLLAQMVVAFGAPRSIQLLVQALVLVCAVALPSVLRVVQESRERKRLTVRAEASSA